MKPMTKVPLFIVLFSIILLALLFFQSCNKIDEDSTPDDIIVSSMKDMVVDAGFDWKTTKEVNVDIQFIEDASLMTGLSNVVLELLDKEGQNVLFRGVSDNEGRFTGSISVPSYYDKILLSTTFKDTLLPVVGNNLDCKVFTRWVDVNGTLGDSNNGRRGRRALTNLLINSGFSTNSFDSSSNYKGSGNPVGKWYYKKGNGSNKVYAFRATYNSDYVMKLIKDDGWFAQVVDSITPGVTYTLNCDGKILSGLDDDEIELKLQFVKSNLSSKVSEYKIKTNWSSNWQTRTITATAPNNTAYIRVYVKVKEDGAAIFDNLSLNALIDSDNDGVYDDEDDYPNDATKAFDNYYPSNDGFASLAFEDLWPYTGDYDFNDLVINYRMNPITNASNKVVEIQNYIKVVAIGGSFHNGFGVQYPVSPSVVNTVTGQQLNHNYISISSNKTEASQTNAVVIMFDDAFDLLPHPGSGTKFVNSTIGETYVTPQTITITVKLGTAQSISAIGTPPYNPFIIIDKTRSKEIHLANYAPTSLASSSILGTGNDDSDPNNSRYYVTSGNLPWGLNIPSVFAYPKEKTDITSGYLKFPTWASTSGNSYSDWYDNKSGYRTSSNLYSH